MPRAARYLCVAATLALAGCQTLPREVPAVDDGTPAAEAFSARRAELAAVTTWTLRGRSAVSADGRGWSGAVHWRQVGRSLDLRLIAPLGAGTLRLTGEPDRLRIRASDGTDFVSFDPAYDLGRALGAPLPVGALRWWVLGIPHPDAPVVALTLDVGGRAVAFEQGGWRVSFPSYTELDGTVMPGVVMAETDGARVRLVVEDWAAS